MDEEMRGQRIAGIGNLVGSSLFGTQQKMTPGAISASMLVVTAHTPAAGFRAGRGGP
jgi:hypothetical protein